MMLPHLMLANLHLLYTWSNW